VTEALNSFRTNEQAGRQTSSFRWIQFGFEIVKKIIRFGWDFLGSLVPFRLFFTGQNSLAPDPIRESQNFLDKFEREFGQDHPRFFVGSYSQAVQQAKREFKLLVIYLHSEQHVDTPTFCRDSLCSRPLTEFIDDNLLFWASNINQSSEGYRVTQILGVSRFPFIGVIRTIENTTALIGKFEGRCLAEDLIQQLAQLIETQSHLLSHARRQEEERARNRLIREEQDVAYQESLAADQEKERKAREEEQRRIELERAIIELEERKKTEFERKRESLPPEPPSGEGVQVLIKLPSGARLNRRFLGVHKFQDVYNFVDVNQNEIEPDSYQLVSNFPRRTFSERQQTLQEASLGSQALLLVNLL